MGPSSLLSWALDSLIPQVKARLQAFSMDTAPRPTEIGDPGWAGRNVTSKMTFRNRTHVSTEPAFSVTALDLSPYSFAPLAAEEKDGIVKASPFPMLDLANS